MNIRGGYDFILLRHVGKSLFSLFLSYFLSFLPLDICALITIVCFIKLNRNERIMNLDYFK